MRSTKSRISAVFAAILAAAGIAAAAWAFRGVHSAPAANGACPAERNLGSIAYLRSGDLHVRDLTTCRDRVVARGARPPVRWSPDGRWIAFGKAHVVPARGGRVTQPLGSSIRAQEWAWSAHADVLAGINAKRGVVLGGPGRHARALLPNGWGAGDLAF